jgi:hypothetical protein
MNARNQGPYLIPGTLCSRDVSRAKQCNAMPCEGRDDGTLMSRKALLHVPVFSSLSSQRRGCSSRLLECLGCRNSGMTRLQRGLPSRNETIASGQSHSPRTRYKGHRAGAGLGDDPPPPSAERPRDDLTLQLQGRMIGQDSAWPGVWASVLERRQVPGTSGTATDLCRLHEFVGVRFDTASLHLRLRIPVSTTGLLRPGRIRSRRTGFWGSSPFLCRFGAETGLSPRRRLRNDQICRNIQVSQAKPAPC